MGPLEMKLLVFGNSDGRNKKSKKKYCIELKLLLGAGFIS